MSQKQDHILVIRNSSMGDVAMCVPVLLTFVASYPQIKLTVLTKSLFAPFFEKVPNTTVKILDPDTKHKGVSGLFKLFWQLKRTKITAVADLHNVLRSNILKGFYTTAGTPFQQIDKGRDEKKALTSWDNDKIFEPLITTHQRYADVFKKLGFPILLNAKNKLPKEILDDVTNQFIGASNLKWIGIAPFAQHDGKEYPFELMLQVMEELSKKDAYKLFLFGGGKNEINLLKNTSQKFSNTIAIAGNLTMKQELSLISNLDIMISMDSGNGHLAAIYGIPVVCIWGVTHPYTGFAPFFQNEKNNILPDLIIYDKIPTSVYGNKFPEGYEKVMHSILPESIIDRVVEVVG